MKTFRGQFLTGKCDHQQFLRQSEMTMNLYLAVMVCPLYDPGRSSAVANSKFKLISTCLAQMLSKS